MKLVPLFALFGLLPLAGRGQSGMSEPLQVNEAQPLPAQTALLAKPATAMPVVAVTTATKMLADRRHIVLDVRTPAEFASGHLQGARNIDFRASDFQAQIARLDPNASYVLYCASGNRSGQAAAEMQKKGIKKVANLGGYNTLKNAGAK